MATKISHMCHFKNIGGRNLYLFSKISGPSDVQFARNDICDII